MTIRPNDRLSNLPSEDRAKLDAWLKTIPYRKVLQAAAAPRPEGLALKTTLRALSKYFNKYLCPDPVAQLAELIKICPEAGEKAATSMVHAQALMLGCKIQTHFNLNAFSLLMRYHRQIVEEKRHARLHPK